MTHSVQSVLTKSRLHVATLAIVAGYFIRNAFLYEDTDDAQVDGDVMPLSARISGQLQEVRVIDGQLVHAGDVLVVIDPKDYKIAVDQAKANLADAEATAASSMWRVPVLSATAWSTLDSSQTAIHNAEAGVQAAGQNLESAKAALLQAQVNAEKTDADLVRYSQLVCIERGSHGTETRVEMEHRRFDRPRDIRRDSLSRAELNKRDRGE